MRKKLRFIRPTAVFCLLLLAAVKMQAQNVSATWGANANTAWYTGGNWVGNSYAGAQGATAASNTNVATFTSAFTGTTVGINMNTNSLNLGAISVDNTRTTTLGIGNSSSAASGVLRLYGSTVNSVANTIVRHNGTNTLTLQANQAGTMGVVLSNATENIATTDNTGNLVISAILSGTGKLTKTGSGTGTVTLSGVNTYSGGTTITSGSLVLGVANALPTSGTVTFNGGTLSTGNTTGFAQATAGTRTLALSENSTLALGTGNHTLAFAASSAVSWTSGKTLTITGWTGTVGAGTTGTAGKLLIGTSTAGLTAAQLSQIKFTISSVDYPAIQLATGEVVPALKYVITSVSPAAPTAGTAFSVTVQAQNYNGVAANVANASTFALSTNGNAGVLGGTTTGAIASGTSSVTVNGVTLSTPGTGVTVTATRSSGDYLVAATSAAFTVAAAATPVLTISGTPTDHGSLCVGSSGSAVTYTIANVGSSGASGVTVVSNNPQFVVTGPSSTSIAASGTATYTVVFTPTAGGSQSATITVSSAESNSPTSALTGTGIASVTGAVTTSAATAINNTIATLNGNVTTLGVCPATTEKGFVYSQTSVNGNPLVAGTGVTKTSVAGLATGTYTLGLSSLPPATQYSYKAYVFNGTTYVYGAVQTFTTLAAADRVAFVGVPANGNVGVALASFTVEARRPDNTVDTNYTGSIVLSKATGAGALTGTLSVNAVSGVATFSTATFGAVGTYTLRANSAGLTQATSGNIVINLAPVTIAAWSFFGQSSPATLAATTFDSHLDNTSSLNLITRGPDAVANTAANSFRTPGFENDGISVANDDYFQTTLKAMDGYGISLSSITGVYAGTSSFYASPGVTSQYAYSLNGTTFTLIGSPVQSTSLSPPAIDVTGVAALQNVPAGTTITIRYYASGQTTTGGWGYSSPTSGSNGLAFSGNVICADPRTTFTVTGGGSTCDPAGLAVGLSGSETGVSYQLKRNGSNIGSAVAGTGSALSFGNQSQSGTYTVEGTNTASGCTNVATMTGSATITLTTTTTWTGAADSNWGNAANWSCNAVPTATSDVVIPSGNPQPVISVDAFANTITLQTGTLLTVLSGYDLTVTDAITSNAGNITIENNANLIQVNNVANTGVAKVKRNSSALMRQDYTLWSSPVSGQNLLPFSAQTLTNRFYTYNTATNLYNTVSNPNTTEFATGVGYLIRMPNNHPTTPTVWNGEFNGTLHNGDIAVPLQNIAAGERFNAIGNPYPSAISMTAFASNNSANITGALYFWRKTNNPVSPSYCSWTAGGGFVGNGEAQALNPQGIIRTGQGFIVEASASGTQVAFHNAQRSADNANQFFRSASEPERNRVWLNATGTSGAFSQALVGYIEGATLENDAQIDGKFFNDGEIALYSLIAGERFAIQGRPLPFDNNDVVPMGFRATNAGSYSIAIDQTDGFFSEGQEIYLRDNVTGSVHELHSGAYTFASDAGTFDSRFDLIYQNSLGVNNPVTSAVEVVAYKQNGRLVINSGSATMDSVKVYDVSGRLLADRQKINANEVSLSPSTANQLLLVQVKTSENITVLKKVSY